MTSPVELLLRTMEDLGDKELKKFHWFLHQADLLHGFPAVPKSCLETADREGTVDVMIHTYGRHRAVVVTGKVLEKMNRNDLAQCLSNTDSGQHALSRRPSPPQLILSYQRILRSNFQSRYMCVPEGLSKQRDKKHLDDIYTELYVTEGGDASINCMHEVRHVEITSRKLQGPDKPIALGDLFTHPSGKCIPIRTVLTNGIAGIGKTFLVYKFMLDWAEGTSSQDVHLTFPFTFRQLNLLKGKTFCLSELIHTCIRETVGIDEKALNDIFTTLQTSGNSDFDKSDYKVLFVLDGLDESRLKLDFAGDNDYSVDITKPTTVDVLMTNLIEGKLLPSARLWITTRPAAASQISADYIDRVTEVRGFTDQQKEEYFRKRFEDEDLASRLISHIKKSRSLYIMCHIPVFCWISATVLEQVLSTEGGDIIKDLTEMYTHFLVFQIKQTSLKYGEVSSLQSIQLLAKLAFDQLEKGTLIFYEGDLKNSGINFNEASLFSGVFTQIFKEERGLHEDKVFSFVHLTIQEYLAAVHVVSSQINNNKNVLKHQTFQCLRTRFKKITATDIHMIAVDKAVQSSNGHLDLFLRFLLGLSLETNQVLLQGLLRQTDSSPQSKQDIVNYIKKKIRETKCPERVINLFHCLNELNDHSLVEEIQRYLNTGSLSTIKLHALEWSALAFVLLTSGEKLDVFDLRKYCKSDEGLLKMLPLVKASTTAILSHCELSSRCCKALGFSVTITATLKELDLGTNNLQNSGIELLSAGLGNPHCKLETLRLSNCQLTEEACVSLGSALDSNHSHLRELDLSYNNLQDVGVHRLLPGLRNLKILRLKDCGLTEDCCSSVASLLSSSICRLTELDLSGNDVGDRGVKLLSAGLASPHCMLETLMLSGCLIIDEGCASLGSALSSNPSYLRELDLSYNHPGDEGIATLSAGLEDPLWKLDMLCVDYCGESRIQPGHMKYAHELTMDPNTAHTNILLAEGNREAMVMMTAQPYPPHPERFQMWRQVLCTEGLTGRCYWEVERHGVVHVGVTYKDIQRQGRDEHSRLGWNDRSWSLSWRSMAWHDGKGAVLPAAPSHIERLAVYLDWPAGILSFYNVLRSSRQTSHIYTFHATFTEPLYPGFWLIGHGSSALLCKVPRVFQIIRPVVETQR